MLEPQAAWWRQLLVEMQLGVARCHDSLGDYGAAIWQCDLATQTAAKAEEPRRLLVDAHVFRFKVCVNTTS